MKFSEYRRLREGKEVTNEEVATKITLGDGNDYKPFFVSDHASSEHAGKNAALAPIGRAFKKGTISGWTRDKDAGEQKAVKIGGKKLYMTGGGVRDILKGKTPSKIELATDATPTEIKKILKQNGFDGGNSTRAAKGDQTFKIKQSNSKGEPFVFDITVDGNTFELSTFRKDPMNATEPEHGTHTDDSRRKDLTINAMYLLLSNDDGPNKELIDFHGGIHDLSSGNIKFVGDAKSKLKESPICSLRAARMANEYGNGRKSISPEDAASIKELSSLLQKLNKDELYDEFMKGLGSTNVDPKELLSTYEELGLLGNIFPEMQINKEFPKELTDLSNPTMSLAWILKDNDSKNLKGLKDGNKVDFLADLLKIEPDWLNAESLNSLVGKFLQSGLTNKDVVRWSTKLGGQKPYVIEALIKHIENPRVKVFKIDNGNEVVEDGFSDLVSPFTGKPTEETIPEIINRKKSIELNNFMSILHEIMPKNDEWK